MTDKEKLEKYKQYLEIGMSEFWITDIKWMIEQIEILEKIKRTLDIDMYPDVMIMQIEDIIKGRE